MKKKLKEKEVKTREIEDLKNKLVRALADYDNLQKRVEKEKEGLASLSSLKIISKLLPVYDMLIDAKNELKDSGLAIIVKEFEEVLKEEGIERIEAGKGVKFDENVHEAVEVEAGKGNKEIVEEVLTGWKYKDGMVIRPAKVKVRN